MALDAGKLKFTLEYGKDLKDLDFFGKQDPYAIIKCGTQTARSKTHIDGGRNPVWAQTFEFNIINENTIEVGVYDEDDGSKDDLIGTASVTLAKVREQKHDKAAVPLVSKKGKQHGFVHVSLAFETNDSLKQTAPAAAGYAPAAPVRSAAPAATLAPAPAPYPYPYPNPYPYPAPPAQSPAAAAALATPAPVTAPAIMPPMAFAAAPAPMALPRHLQPLHPIPAFAAPAAGHYGYISSSDAGSHKKKDKKDKKGKKEDKQVKEMKKMYKKHADEIEGLASSVADMFRGFARGSD